MGTSHTVHREIELTTLQGVAVELRHVLPDGWTMTRESDSFVVRGEISESFEDQVWRVVRFVAYPAFLTLQRTLMTTDETRYELVSSNAAGHGFRVVFILTRPRPTERTPADTPSLIAALEADPGRAIAAAREIARAGLSEAIPALLEVLRSTSDHAVRDATAMALSDLRAPQALAAIVGLLGDPRTLGSRGTLLHALRPFDCSSILEMLIEFVIEGNWEVSREAMELLGSIDAPVGQEAWQAYVTRVETALKHATEERAPLLRDLLSMLAGGDSG
jgi:hypothetical protein